jgi:hypothetical protein
LQAQQAGSPLQSVSPQSFWPSQSLSKPSLQVLLAISRAAGAPQSSAQSQAVSPAAHWPSPQQRSVGSFVHDHQLDSHRMSAQETGLTPPPAPQQNHPLMGQYCLPLQSAEQVRQSSPSPASQTPLPQTAPLPAAPQSSGQVQLLSVVSHVPLPQQTDISVWEQLPPEQRSVVQESLSSHSASLLHSQFAASKTQAPLTQKSTVHVTPSLQVIGVPLHAPLPHRSLVVQELPSLQVLVLFVYQQAPLLHESFVHGLPSLQLTGVPVQAPAAHTSPDVQALLSLHGLVLFTRRHVPALQKSLVQGLLSLHWLWLVQPHAAVLCWQTPLAQESTLQARPSSQFIAVPRHKPAAHRSLVVQALLSLHVLVLFERTQVPLEHESLVHGLLSSQFIVVPRQTPLLQKSFVVQALPSLHAAVLLACWQLPPTHVSVVQALLSLHCVLLVH